MKEGLTLWRRIVEVLGCHDERSEKDPVTCAVHPLCDLGQLGLQPIQVDERAEECGDLDVGLLDEDGDEGLERWESRGLFGFLDLGIVE